MTRRDQPYPKVEISLSTNSPVEPVELTLIRNYLDGYLQKGRILALIDHAGGKRFVFTRGKKEVEMEEITLGSEN